MSLLTIVQQAAAELIIPQPSAVVSSTDTQTLQLYALAQKEGKELARRFDWQILMKEATFTTLAATTQGVLTTIATDFGRIVDQSMWNRTRHWPIKGPYNAQQWQAHLAAAAQVGPYSTFRIRGGSILFTPTPTAGDSVYFEYISNKWCQSAALVAQTAWAADLDTALIDEEIIRLGIVWRFKKSKGFDYSEDFRTYEMALEQLFGPDGGKEVVDMNGGDQDMGYPSVNIQDGNWNI